MRPVRSHLRLWEDCFGFAETLIVQPLMALIVKLKSVLKAYRTLTERRFFPNSFGLPARDHLSVVVRASAVSR